MLADVNVLVFCNNTSSSCRIAHDKEIICYQNFKNAKDLAYNNPSNTSSLNSALILANRCIQCDSIIKPVIELKLRLLVTLGKYKEGSEFVDSLRENDFEFPYKKTLNHDNFLALQFQMSKDTNNRNLIYRKMASNLEQYINSKNLNSKEFEEAFLDLYSIKENFIDSIVINREIDSLKIKYPNNVKFFDFFRQ